MEAIAADKNKMSMGVLNSALVYAVPQHRFSDNLPYVLSEDPSSPWPKQQFSAIIEDDFECKFSFSFNEGRENVCILCKMYVKYLSAMLGISVPLPLAYSLAILEANAATYCFEAFCFAK
uniref:Rho-GAP domain-containing protein n=1 Tax=Steinernema glaseri TaxID=37863 RepID=A0A1I7ZFA9_9BILA